MPKNEHRTALRAQIEVSQEIFEVEYHLSRDFQSIITDSGVMVTGNLKTCILMLRQQGSLSVAAANDALKKVEDLINTSHKSTEEQGYIDHWQKTYEKVTPYYDASTDPDYKTGLWT